MKSIEYIKLHNFRSHKDSLVQFGNFTAIVGPTNAGKTAIIRGLIWGLFNIPSGSSFVRRGSSNCSVEIGFSDESKLIRERTGTKNFYHLISNKGEETVLEHFGSGTVDLVAEFHGMRPLDLFGDQKVLNICEQLEPPFFISESPSVRALMIGRMAGVEKYDLAIKNGASELLAEKKKKTVLNASLKEKKAALKEYAKVDSNAKKIDKIKTILVSLDEMAQSYDRQEKLVKECQTIKESLAHIREKLKIELQVRILSDTLSELTEDAFLYYSVKECAELKDAAQSRIDACNDVLEKLKSFDADALETICTESEDDLRLYRSLDELREKAEQTKIHIENMRGALKFEKALMRADDILSLINEDFADCQQKEKLSASIWPLKSEIRGICQQIEQKNAELEGNYNEYAEILKQTQICPTCSSVMDDEHINNAIDELRREDLK